MIERVKNALAQTQAILDTMPPSLEKERVAFAFLLMKSVFKEIEEKNLPCPPYLEAQVEQALKGIEELYNKTASN